MESSLKRLYYSVSHDFLAILSQLTGVLLGLISTILISRYSGELLARYSFVQSALELLFGFVSFGVIGFARKKGELDLGFMLVSIFLMSLVCLHLDMTWLETVILSLLMYIFKVLHEALPFVDQIGGYWIRSLGRVVMVVIPIVSVLLNDVIYPIILAVFFSLFVLRSFKAQWFNLYFNSRLSFSAISILSVVMIFFDKVFFYERIETEIYAAIIVVSKLAMPLYLIKGLMTNIFGVKIVQNMISSKNYKFHLFIVNSLSLCYIVIIYLFKSELELLFKVPEIDSELFILLMLPGWVSNISLYANQYLQIHDKEQLVLIGQTLFAAIPVLAFFLLGSVYSFYITFLIVGFLVEISRVYFFLKNV